MDPMLTRAEHYVGMAYVEGEFDCADLAALVQRELFGRAVALPDHAQRPRGARGQAGQIHRLRADLADRIDAPELGCGVLMWEPSVGGIPRWHIGTAFLAGGEIWVLHTSCALGGAVLQRLADMRRQYLHVEGFYRWK